MKCLKYGAAAGGALSIALFAAPVFATSWDAWEAMTSATITTDDDPDDFGGITVGDKTITLIDYGAGTSIQGSPQDASTFTASSNWNKAAADLEVSFSVDPVNDRYQVNLNPSAVGAGSPPFDLTGLNTGDTLAIQYVINIDPSTYPPAPGDLRFGSIFLGLNVVDSGGLTVSKRVQGLTPNGYNASDIAWSLNNNFAVGTFFDKTISTDGQTEFRNRLAWAGRPACARDQAVTIASPWRRAPWSMPRSRLSAAAS